MQDDGCFIEYLPVLDASVSTDEHVVSTISRKCGTLGAWRRSFDYRVQEWSTPDKCAHVNRSIVRNVLSMAVEVRLWSIV